MPFGGCLDYERIISSDYRHVRWAKRRAAVRKHRGALHSKRGQRLKYRVCWILDPAVPCVSLTRSVPVVLYCADLLEQTRSNILVLGDQVRPPRARAPLRVGFGPDPRGILDQHITPSTIKLTRGASGKGGPGMRNW